MDPASADEYIAAAELRIRLLHFQRRTEQITSRHGMTPQRYLLLLITRVDALAGAPTTVGSLGRPLQMSQSSVTRLVQGAVRAGLIQQEVDPRDHRRHHLQLTAQGSQRLDVIFRELGPERDAVAQALGATAGK